MPARNQGELNAPLGNSHQLRCESGIGYTLEYSHRVDCVCVRMLRVEELMVVFRLWGRNSTGSTGCGSIAGEIGAECKGDQGWMACAALEVRV